MCEEATSQLWSAKRGEVLHSQPHSKHLTSRNSLRIIANTVCSAFLFLLSPCVINPHWHEYNFYLLSLLGKGNK